MNDTDKICSKCGKPGKFFVRGTRLESWCAACKNEKTRLIAKRHAEANRANPPETWSSDKQCSMCKGNGPFGRNNERPDGFNHRCIECDARRRRELRLTSWSSCALRSARERAKKSGLSFDLTIDDLFVPEYCPVLPHIKLEIAIGKGKGGEESSPSVDRVDPNIGYVRGNVRVISNRANRVKNDGTAEEHEAIARYIREVRCA